MMILGYYKHIKLTLYKGLYHFEWKEMIKDEWQQRIFKGTSKATTVSEIISDVIGSKLSVDKEYDLLSAAEIAQVKVEKGYKAS